MNNQDILFASLMGTKAVETLESITQKQGDLYNTVLPPIPFLPFINSNGISTVTSPVSENLWQANKPLIAEHQYFPLSFSFVEKGTKWLFPFEPLISISGSNNIAKRKVAKATTGGTIKEKWSQNDYEITITGALFGAIERGNQAECYPRGLMTELFSFLKKASSIIVFSDQLLLLGITRIVIEEYRFPFTKGENVQAFEIKASSDMAFNLLTEIENPKI